MIIFGSDLMTKANADLFALDHPDVEIIEISLELDLYEVKVYDIQNVGQTTYNELIDFSSTLPYLEMPVEEEEDLDDSDS